MESKIRSGRHGQNVSNVAWDKNRYLSTMDTTTGEIGRAAAIEARLFGPQGQGAANTPALISAMLDSGKGISDLIFSPGRPPQVERHGELVPVLISGAECLTTDDTARIARDLIGGNVQALGALENEGAADFPYSSGVA